MITKLNHIADTISLKTLAATPTKINLNHFPFPNVPECVSRIACGSSAGPAWN